MGNTLTTATINATSVIAPPPSKQIDTPASHAHFNMSGSPPPECPMHKKMDPPKFVSECPVHPGDNSDINPLNMVGKC